MEWTDGVASIKEASTAIYWQLVETPCTVGLLKCCLVDLKQGIARACSIVDPNLPCNLPETAANLEPMDFSSLLQQAMETPKVPSSYPPLTPLNHLTPPYPPNPLTPYPP